MSRVMCHMSRFMCHISHVTCHVSNVTSHIFFLTPGWSQSVEGLLSTRSTPSSLDEDKTSGDHLSEVQYHWTCIFCGRSGIGHLNDTCLYCFSTLVKILCLLTVFYKLGIIYSTQRLPLAAKSISIKPPPLCLLKMSKRKLFFWMAQGFRKV